MSWQHPDVQDTANYLKDTLNIFEDHKIKEDLRWSQDIGQSQWLNLSRKVSYEEPQMQRGEWLWTEWADMGMLMEMKSNSEVVEDRPWILPSFYCLPIRWSLYTDHPHSDSSSVSVHGIPPRFLRPVDSKHISNGIQHTGTSPEVISCLFVSPEVIFRSMKYLQPPPNFLSFRDLSVGSSHCLDTLPTFRNSSATRIVALASEALLPLPLRFPITFLPILDITFPHSLHPLFEPTSRRT